MLRVLYFASVREAVGIGEELLDVPPDLSSIAALVDWLATISPTHAAAFANRDRLRAAVDGRFVGMEADFHDASEVALFPPVTGG